MTTDFQRLTAREQHSALFVARRLHVPLAKVAGVIVETERCSKKPPSELPMQVCQLYQDMMGYNEDAPGRPETRGVPADKIMRVTKHARQFKKRGNHMRIGLVGMSGVGKTYWATKLANIGFECIDCDDMIGAHLAAELGKPISFDDLNRWLGLPYEPEFKAREAMFLSFEAQTLRTILDDLSQVDNPAGALVIDMTGSAIYAGPAVFRKLRQLLTIVYLAITPDVHQRMFDEYTRRPRAVIWKGQFKRNAGDTQLSALKACYPHLIAFRERWYEEYCDVKLEYATHRQANLTAAEFEQCIRNATEHMLAGDTPPA